MNLLTRFNLIFILVFVVGLTLVGYFSRQLLVSNALGQIHEQATLMMDTSLAVRDYTMKNIKPALQGRDSQISQFHPETVPAFAATEVFLKLTNPDPLVIKDPRYSEYSYKEATLNPTNPRDKAQDWEADIINDFRKNHDRKQIIGQRETPSGGLFYLAQPLPVKASCLACHDRVDNAPPEMIVHYGLAGTQAGFGWKDGEIIGAQIVSVPISKAVKIAESSFRNLVVWLLIGGLLTLGILNAVLYFAVIKPIKRIAVNADNTSKGQMDVPEVPVEGAKEIAVLALSFNRMHRSLTKAMKLIDEQ